MQTTDGGVCPQQTKLSLKNIGIRLSQYYSILRFANMIDRDLGLNHIRHVMAYFMAIMAGFFRFGCCAALIHLSLEIKDLWFSVSMISIHYPASWVILLLLLRARQRPFHWIVGAIESY